MACFDGIYLELLILRKATEAINLTANIFSVILDIYDGYCSQRIITSQGYPQNAYKQ
jgi:hypothetical protein